MPKGKEKMTHSIIDSQGKENFVFCVKCYKDRLTGRCNGEQVYFENDHKKQTCTVEMGNPSAGRWRTLAIFKDEVFTEGECVRWLKQNGYKQCKRKGYDGNMF